MLTKSRAQNLKGERVSRQATKKKVKKELLTAPSPGAPPHPTKKASRFSNCLLLLS